jgi:ParB family chromosome partitioning protein
VESAQGAPAAFLSMQRCEVASQRSLAHSIEEAQAYKRLVDEYGHTQEELGKLVHKSRSHVANLLRLLDLPAKVQVLLGTGQLQMGDARALITAKDPEGLAEEVIRRGLSVRETVKLAAAGKTARQRRLPIEYKGAGADIAALERQLGDLLGLKVSIKHSPKGGQVTLAYSLFLAAQ